MEQYIQVVEEEFDEPVELPIEAEDNTLLISTLSAQFPSATGLKHRNESTGNWRGVRVNDGKLQAPDGVWADTMVFCVVYPKGHASNSEGKRKGEQVFDTSGTTAKMKRQGSEMSGDLKQTSDLVILGLAYTADEEDIKSYFETFGRVLMTQIKKDHNTQKSKGFGFVRMGDYDSQIKILSQRHNICGRWCEVKLPNSNMNRSAADSDILNRKIFVGRCTEEVTQEDLRDYFTKFGEVVDVYIPKPFRAFSFVTFANPHVAAGLHGQDHIINNASVHISSADPKDNYRNKGNDYRGRNDRGRSSSPNRTNNYSGNSSAMSNQQGPPGGNMGNMGGGFNMGNFPMNPAMFAALASQGMFGMPGMMGPGGPMGFPNQQQPQQQQGSNPSGYGSNQNGATGAGNYNYNSYGQGYNQGYSQQQPQNGAGGWPGTSGASGDNKDLKGTSNWSQSQNKGEPMNSSWN